jgi:hypothetical protein
MRSRNAERAKVLDELEKLRKKPPADYALRSARLLDRLRELDQRRPRYAIT